MPYDKMVVKANPKKPYKMYAAMLSSALTVGLATWIDAPSYVVIIATMVTSALAVYMVPNPIVRELSSY